MNPRILGIIGGLALIVALLSPFMMGSSKKVEQLFQSAEDLYGQADYEGAIGKYTEALEESTKRGVKTEVIDKDFPTLANYKIAVSYSRLAEQSGDVNHYDTAIEYIEKVAPTATIPKHQEGLTYLWGHILYRTEQFELAEPKFTQLIENFPNSLFVENAWYAIGQLNYKLQNYEDSRQAFKAVLDGFPNSDFKDDAQHLIAQSFLNESNYEQAYQEFDKIATEEFKNYPDLQAEAMYKAAYSLNQLGRDDESIGRYTNFITQFPESQYVTAAYFDQGAIYARQKDYDNARVNYELALQNTADRTLQSEIQSAIGRTYFDQGDYENAIVSYQTLLEEYPESDFIAEAKLGIADSHFRLENWSEATSAYQRVINEHEEATDFIPYCSYQIGEAYYKLGSDQVKAGDAETGMGTLELALQWYQKTVDDYPQDPVAPHALYGAIWALNDLGRKDELETIAREFIEKNKNDNEFDILAAEVQLRFADIKRTEFKQYIEAAEEYAKLWDYRPLPKFHLVKLMGKFFEGRSYYEAAKPEGYQEGDADANFNADYLGKSVSAYQEAIAMFTDDAFLPGVAEERYDDFSERIAQVEACIMNEALSHEMLGDWTQARDRYASIPETSEYYERALLLVANSHVKEGDKEGAISYYNSILDKLADADNRSLAEIKLADLLRAEERFEEAAVQYQAVVDGNPTGEYADDALYLVGLCYYQAASENPALLESSEAAFKRVIADYADSPNAVEAYYGLALAYRDAAQKQDDTEKWPLILQLADEANDKYASSDNELVLKTLGHIDLIKATAIENTGEEVDVDALVASLKRIVDNTGAPEEARSRSQLKIGHTYYSAKRYDEALAEYLLFVQTFPNSELAPNAQYQAAVCHYQIAQSATDAGSKQLSLQNAVSAAEKVSTLTEDANNLISANYTAGLALLGLEDNKGAADAFKAVTALEGQTEDEARKSLIFQAHSRLAELNGTLGDHAGSVQEYQYIIENTEEADMKGRSYFAMAFAQEEQLKTYQDALMSYQNAIELVEDDLVKAQSYYRIGLIYQDQLKQPSKALETFQTLIGEYSGSANTNVASMVADAGIRRSTLYVELGRLDEAITEAVEALDRTKGNPNASVAEKAAAQYNLGFLYSDKARSLFSTEAGTDLKPYIDASRNAAGAFFEVASIAAPVEKADKQTVIPYVQNSLFQSGQIYYSVGIGVKLPQDLVSALSPLTTFVSYVDKGLFPKSDALRKNTETALNYTAASNFELGRMQVGMDGEMSEKAVSYFTAAGDVFRDMVRRYPSANDAAFWQYHVGESYYAAQQFEKAITEYEKVRTVNKTHKSAAESLYAISTCAQLLSEAAEKAGDEDAKQRWYDRLFEANEVLAAEYPNSQYTADALINIGNKYYNAGSETELEQAERIRLYQMAIENYQKAINTPGIGGESKSTAQGYLNDTANALAFYEYEVATDLLNESKLARGEEQKPAVEAAIAEYQKIIEAYPGTKYADLGLVQIGEAYMVLADSDDAYFNDALDYFNRLWAKYETTPPVDTKVNQALTYAISQVQTIISYMQSNNLEIRGGAGAGAGGGGGGE
ncbi:tetratricopeptide repeat protein [Candidatus Poribacteria bacterium]|nr:tetratricopeptide repeat protein [Candidatus Poribacteria bacterium]MYA55679.1 tetratricopeptide repeat protein [Candidatus Poribacteria bacterium]